MSFFTHADSTFPRVVTKHAKEYILHAIEANWAVHVNEKKATGVLQPTQRTFTTTYVLFHIKSNFTTLMKS